MPKQRLWQIGDIVEVLEVGMRVMGRLRHNNPPQDRTHISPPDPPAPRELTPLQERAERRWRREARKASLPPRPLTPQEEAQRERDIARYLPSEPATRLIKKAEMKKSRAQFGRRRRPPQSK